MSTIANAVVNEKPEKIGKINIPAAGFGAKPPSPPDPDPTTGCDDNAVKNAESVCAYFGFYQIFY
jgi:hypothetical protein